MLIRFKNKMTVAIIGMIEKGRLHGGLPSVIEISVDEAQRIIEEINTLRNDPESQHSRYTFKYGNVDTRLAFISKNLTQEEMFALLTDWTDQKLKVWFDTIPLVIVIEIDKKDTAHHVY